MGRRIARRLPGLIGLVVFVLALYVLQRALADVELADVVAGFRAIAPTALLAAALLTALNYLVQTLYDLLGLRYAGSPLSWRSIVAPAYCAMAVGHNVGVSAVSGGAIRYRAYAARGLETATIARVIAFYPISYALGAVTLLGTTLAIEPSAVPERVRLDETTIRLVGASLCLVPLGWLFWSARARRPLALWRWRIEPPAPRLAALQILLAVTDILLSTTVLYLLLPAQSGTTLLAFVGVYTASVTLGTVSGVPGGLGVIEGSLLLLLPEVPPPALLGSLLAWRVLYFLTPLALALVLLGAQLWRERAATSDGR